MDLRDILEKEAPRSVSSTPNSPAQSPFKYVQRTQSGPLQKQALGASPLSQKVMLQANIPAHVLSPAQQPLSSPLISPVPAMSTTPHSTRAPSTPSMDALADLASMQNHQPVKTTPPLLRGRNSYESRGSPSYPVVLGAALSSNHRASFDINMVDIPKQSIRTDFSDTSIPIDRQERLSQLVTYTQENPSAYDSHVELVQILHEGFIDHIYPSSDPGARRSPDTYDLLPDLRNAREQMAKLFAVGETLWGDWLQDESMLAQTAEERIVVVEKFKKAVGEEAGSVKLWAAYGDWVHHCYSWASDTSHDSAEDGPDEERFVGREVFTRELVLNTWRDAVEQTNHDLAQSHITWNKYFEFRLPNPEEKLDMNDVELGLSLYQERLRQPHMQWDDTFQAFSSFVSANIESRYEHIMSETNRAASNAKQKMAVRELYETRIEQFQRARNYDAEYQAFMEYIEWEMTSEKRKKPDVKMIHSLFQRAELRFPSDTSLWEEHAAVLLGGPASSLLLLLERATKHCPWSGSLWSQYLLTSDRMGQTFQETESIKHNATSTGLLEAAGIEEVVMVHAAWCSYLRRRSSRPDGSEEDIDVAEMGIRSSIENVSSVGAKLGVGDAADPSFRLHRIYITFLTESGRWDNARHEFDTLIKEYGNSWEFWTRFYQWEMMRWRRFASNQQESEDESLGHVAPPHLATAVLKKALDQGKLDYPEPIMQMFLTHCEDYEDADELQQALLQVRRLKKAFARHQKEEIEQHASMLVEQDGQEDGSHSVLHGSKRKREDDVENQSNKKFRDDEAQESVEPAHIDQPKRDRENATVLVENLPDRIADTRIRQYFSNCGVVKGLKVLRDSGVSAIVEFEHDDAAQYALSRDGQDLDGSILSVRMDTGSTLYLTNYKPSADEAYIRALLGTYGEIVGIRFPSLQGNKRRRFCYVQFKSPTGAQAATELDGQDVDGLPIMCKISNPSIRKNREDKSNVNDGRTIFVGHLNFKSSEKEVEKIFAHYGKIEMIRMPRNETAKNRNKGIAFVTYDTTDAANSALAMNGHDLKDRKLVVRIATNDTHRASVSRTTASPAPTANGKHQSPAIVDHSVQQQDSDRRDRQIFLTGIPDTVNESRIRAMGEVYGKVRQVILKTNHQGAIIEFSTVAEAGEAALKLEAYEIDPGKPIRVVSEAEMQSVGREKKLDGLPVAKSKAKDVKKLTPIGTAAPVRRPVQAGMRRGGHLGQRSAALFIGQDQKGLGGQSQANGSVAKKSNDDFRAFLAKK